MLALLGAALALPGCSVCKYAQISSYEEPKVFSRKRDRCASLALYRSMADEALATSGCDCPEGCLVGDFQWGFREGFAQYVYAGGDGEPPAVPPRAYWQVDMRTPEGAAAVRSWFEGYRVGVQVARAGGYRKTATIVASASVRDCTPCGCPEGAGDGDCCPLGSPTFLTSPPRTVDGSVEEIAAPVLTQPELVPDPLEKASPNLRPRKLPAPPNGQLLSVPRLDKTPRFDNDTRGPLKQKVVDGSALPKASLRTTAQGPSTLPKPVVKTAVGVEPVNALPAVENAGTPTGVEEGFPRTADYVLPVSPRAAASEIEVIPHLDPAEESLPPIKPAISEFIAR